MVYALELNDAALVLARASADGRVEVLDESPGFALLEQDRVLTGKAAYARWRLRPRFAHNRYLVDISTDALGRSIADVRTTADLAFTHLREVLRAHGEIQELIVAVPAGYSREQLALLLGVLQECGVGVVGLVDAALAASAQAEMPRRSAHLDLQLHRAVLTLFEHDRASTVVRSHYEINPRAGVMSLQQACMQAIADVFVRKTRFDPLYEAQHEQKLADMLPSLLQTIATADAAECVIDARNSTYTVELTSADLAASLEPIYAELVQLVRAALRAHETLPVALTSRLSMWPGLKKRLTESSQVQARELDIEAAVTGALQHEASIRRPPQSLALVVRLPAALSEAVHATTAHVDVPQDQRPTHVLFSGRAYTISQRPLVIGWSVQNGARAITVPSGVPGVSRAHCTVVQRNGAIVIEDHSTYGSFINDARVQGSGVLKVGDRLRLGTPGIALDLIQVVEDDAAPPPSL